MRLLLLLLITSFTSFGQTKLSYGVGGVLPAGISVKYSIYNRRINPELGIGVFGAWFGSSFRVYDEWSIGAAHGLQMIPSVGGWRSLLYLSKSWDYESLNITAGGGSRFDWFDRQPYPYPVIIFRVCRKI